MDSSLQTENYSLRQQLEALLHEARLNENKMRRFDQLERQLIGAHSLADLVCLLLNDYRQAFGIEFVSLVLVDPEYEAARILAPESTTQGASNGAGNPLHGLLFIQSPTLLETLYGESHQPLLSSFLAHEHNTLFHAGSHVIASLALLPLRRQGELIGSLHLGSTDPQRYSASAGTAFLERLANIIAICLETALIQERLKLVGLTDGLTGVQNRRYFEHRIPVEVSQAKRHQQPLACMFLDIDKFKRINDTHGHQTGDEVLRAVAKLIQGQLRVSDTIARFGGEEFIVLLPQTPGHYALEIAERIRQTIAQHNITNSQREKVPVTISIGLAMLPQLAEQTDIGKLSETLIARADQALYQAKHNGRNQVVSAGVQTPRHARFHWHDPASWLSAGSAHLTKLLNLGMAKTASLRHFVG